jgi:uncharacterized protein YndB with AHSA1/START domain
MTQQTQGIAVQQQITVDAPPERAFEVFTGRIADWWPLENYSIGAQPAVAAEIEPREGGRWGERAADGSTCDWGRVLTWEPPHRIVLSWEISCDWSHDPRCASEVEIRFEPDGAGATRVELEHRGLETYGERAEEMRGIFGSDQGWGGLLRAFAGGVER